MHGDGGQIDLTTTDILQLSTICELNLFLHLYTSINFIKSHSCAYQVDAISDKTEFQIASCSMRHSTEVGRVEWTSSRWSRRYAPDLVWEVNSWSCMLNCIGYLLEKDMWPAYVWTRSVEYTTVWSNSNWRYLSKFEMWKYNIQFRSGKSNWFQHYFELQTIHNLM